MSQLTRRAFVLSSQKYGEQNRILTLLTQEEGLITASVRVAQGRGGFMTALTQAFVYGEFQLFLYRDRYKIDSGVILSAFPELMQSIERLTGAAHLAQVFQDLLQEGQHAGVLYELWAHSLYQISVSDNPLLDVRIAQFRALCESGFAPSMKICGYCHREVNGEQYFSLTDRQVFCKNSLCLSHTANGRVILLPSGHILCLDYVASCSIKRLFLFTLNETLEAEFCSFSDLYLEEIMEKKYHKLDILDQVKTLPSFIVKKESL